MEAEFMNLMEKKGWIKPDKTQNEDKDKNPENSSKTKKSKYKVDDMRHVDNPFIDKFKLHFEGRTPPDVTIRQYLIQDSKQIDVLRNGADVIEFDPDFTFVAVSN